LFHRFKETHKPSKYLILASWPGLAGLFPQADEYWSLQDASQMKRFFEQADGFRNRSDLATIYNRNLNEYFREVNDWRKVVEPYYSNGITQQFWDDYKHVKCFLHTSLLLQFSARISIGSWRLVPGTKSS
jgi:hypothetical protein